MSITLFPVLWLIVEWKFCLRITIFLPTSGPLLELKYLHWFSLCLSRPLILKFNIASDVTYIAHKISLFQQLIPLIVAAGLWKQRTLKQGVHLIKCVWKRTLFDKGILRLRHYLRHHHQRIISPKGCVFLCLECNGYFGIRDWQTLPLLILHWNLDHLYYHGPCILRGEMSVMTTFQDCLIPNRTCLVIIINKQCWSHWSSCLGH